MILGHEGAILRYVFRLSIALAALVGILAHLQALVPPVDSDGAIVGHWGQ